MHCVALAHRGPHGHHQGLGTVSGKVAGHTKMAPAVGPVPGEVEVEHHVALPTEHIPPGGTQGRIRGSDHDAGMIIPKTEFNGRAQHSLRVDPQDATTLDRATIGHARAECRQRDDVTDFHIVGSAPHMAFGAITCIDPHALHLGGVGVPLKATHNRRDNTIDGDINLLDRFHRQPQTGEVIGDPVDIIDIGRVGKGSEFVQP